MKNERYNVLVVGAGPAGSIAARESARAGAKTLLLERDPVIGTPVRCGEASNLNGLKEFIPIQDRWIAAVVDRAYIYVPSGERVELVGKDDPGVVLERNLFDRYLAELAAEAGSEIITRADVCGLLTKNDRVAGVRYSRFGVSVDVEADIVIGADGVDSRVGRWAGIVTQMALKDIAPAYQFIVSGVEFDPTCVAIYVGSFIGVGGYIWIFPKSKSTVLVGMGYSGVDIEKGSAYDRLVAFVKKRFPKASIIGEMAGGVPGAAPIKKPVRNGLILAGDAARHCNPITGGGIYTAMVAGYHAGKTAAAAVSEGDFSARRLSSYCDAIDKKINVLHRRAHSIRRALIGLSDKTINEAARDIISVRPEDRTMSVILYRVLKNHPGMLLGAFKALLSDL